MPFKRIGSVAFKTADQVEQETNDRLRRSDTDGDTINDYDEQYIFRTSPYVGDSDSDGIDDGTEIAADQDPNCPRGKTCRQAKVGDSTAAATQPVTGGTPVAPTKPDDKQVLQVIAGTFGDPTKLTPEMLKERIAKMSATDLRNFLGSLGLPSEALQRADDATLRRLVTEAMSEIVIQSGNGESGAQ